MKIDFGDCPHDIPQEVWEICYYFLSDTKTSQPIEGIDFVIVQEAMARAVLKERSASADIAFEHLMKVGIGGLAEAVRNGGRNE